MSGFESRVWEGVGTREWAEWLGRDVAYWKGSHPVVRTGDGNVLLKTGHVVIRDGPGPLTVLSPRAFEVLKGLSG